MPEKTCEELLDEIHLLATFTLSEPEGYEVETLHTIMDSIEEYYDEEKHH